MDTQPTDPPGMPCGQYLVLAAGLAALGVVAFIGFVRFVRGVSLAVDATR